MSVIRLRCLALGALEWEGTYEYAQGISNAEPSSLR